MILPLRQNGFVLMYVYCSTCLRLIAEWNETPYVPVVTKKPLGLAFAPLLFSEALAATLSSTLAIFVGLKIAACH